jgi:hypothetical protein
MFKTDASLLNTGIGTQKKPLCFMHIRNFSDQVTADSENMPVTVYSFPGIRPMLILIENLLREAG